MELHRQLSKQPVNVQIDVLHARLNGYNALLDASFIRKLCVQGARPNPPVL